MAQENILNNQLLASDTDSSPVHWEPVCKLKNSGSIKYKQLIMKERIPALFPEGCKNDALYFFIGAMYVYSASGKDITPRRVYLEASDPEKPAMRVPKTSEEDKVISSYGWDRTNFVFRNGYVFSTPKYNFQMYTPANHGTYGIRVHDGTPTFEALPTDQTAVGFFAFFQISNTGQKPEHITNVMGERGLYVDPNDGWKVKMTDNTALWDKFRIQGFLPPNSPTE